jgi:hypothetical protein
MNIQADFINYLTPSVSFAQVGRLESQHADSFLNPVLGQSSQTFLGINQNRIIRHKEGQRMARGCVAIRINNRGFAAGKHELLVRGGVNRLLRGAPAVALPDDHLPLGNDTGELAAS